MGCGRGIPALDSLAETGSIVTATWSRSFRHALPRGFSVVDCFSGAYRQSELRASAPSLRVMIPGGLAAEGDIEADAESALQVTWQDDERVSVEDGAQEPTASAAPLDRRRARRAIVGERERAPRRRVSVHAGASRSRRDWFAERFGWTHTSGLQVRPVRADSMTLAEAAKQSDLIHVNFAKAPAPRHCHL